MVRGRKRSWQAVLAALVVAAGVGVAWAVGIHWLDSLQDSFLRSRERVVEDIHISVDGTPVIGAESSALVNRVTVSRRTLDGQPWPLDYEHWLSGAHLGPRNLPPRILELPLEWDDYGSRMIGGTDGRRPPTAWYVVRQPHFSGPAYLAGYDAFSKLPVGYIGRNGFRATVPATADQFALPATYEQRLYNFAASSQYLSPGVVWDHNLYRDGDPAPWLVFMLEADRLWEVDLRQRTARTVLESPGLTSTTPITALESTMASLRNEGEAASTPGQRVRLAAANMQDVFIAIEPRAATVDEKPKYAGAVAVRSDDRVILYHSPSGNQREFLLPKKTADRWIGIYWVSPDQLLLRYESGHWSGGPITQLTWINAAGEIQREEEVKLAGYTPEPPRQKAWKASGLMPVPIVWLVGMVLGAPLYMVQNYFAEDYASAVNTVGSIAWPPLVVVLAIAVVLAWLTLRLQRKYRRPATGMWAAFVFLLGVPGFLAYWLEHRRPKMEACRECGQLVPRDRDVCAACHAAFPPPAPVGTEIFA